MRVVGGHHGTGDLCLGPRVEALSGAMTCFGDLGVRAAREGGDLVLFGEDGVHLGSDFGCSFYQLYMPLKSIQLSVLPLRISRLIRPALLIYRRYNDLLSVVCVLPIGLIFLQPYLLLTVVIRLVIAVSVFFVSILEGVL